MFKMKLLKPLKRLFRWKFWLCFLLLVFVYCGGILGTVYYTVWNSGLKGGGNGPQDAFRHSLASSLVAHTLHPKCINLIIHVMEKDGKGSFANKMDAHNNRIGASIGASVPWSFNSVSKVIKKVRTAVDNGAVQTKNPNQITWMPKKYWVKRRWH